VSRIHDEPSLRRTLWAQGALACALAAWGCPAKDDPGALASKPSASVEAVATTVSHAYHAVPVEDAKAIAVRVDFAHPRLPPSWPIPRMVQSQCGDSDHVLDEALSASPDGGANGAVVWLEDIHEGRPLAAADAVQDEKHCVFTPHILALPASGTLTLTNGDPANHADRFEFGGDSSLDFMKTLPGGGKLGIPIKEDWAGRVARVSCPIHLWMGGYALFFDHPYFAVTQGGVARLEGVPKGSYHLVVWHEGTTTTFDSAIKLAPTRTTRVEVVVANDDVRLSFVIADDGAITKR
jgi:hypothetical protein